VSIQSATLPAHRARPSPRGGTPPYPYSPDDPTYNGFVWFVEYVMAVPSNDMPSAAQLQWAYNQAVNLAYSNLAGVPSQPGTPSIYTMAVYNLGAAFLVEFATDTPPSTYWSDLRTQLGINSFVPGLINSAHDQGTGEGMAIPPNILNGLSLLDMQLLKSPWGQAYLQIAGQWGPIWDIS
jgi:hypothetical protein